MEHTLQRQVLAHVDQDAIVELASGSSVFPASKPKKRPWLGFWRIASVRGATSWRAGIPCLLYGPGVIRGNADEDDSCVLISDMVKVVQVLALTALEGCNRERM